MPPRQLDTARENRKDEFYTQLTDIAKEMKYYKEHFKGKTVFCNCDDPRVSNFFRYFALNFEHLGLKKIICTCYKSSDVDLFSQQNTEQAVSYVYEGDTDGNVEDFSEIKVTPLKGNGDFRSEECIELLKEADIVVTNPPFSLFREYIAQLMKYEKKFIILGNMNAITYKEVFPYIKANQLWWGPSISSGDREFQVPDDYPLKAAGCRVDEQGRKFIRVKGVRWYTNLPTPKRSEHLILYKKYTPEEYPHYDNYDGINVNKTTEIPVDWDGYMGVPITFIDKYCPDQFEIVKFRKGDDEKDLSVNGVCPYFRIIIKKRVQQ